MGRPVSTRRLSLTGYAGGLPDLRGTLADNRLDVVEWPWPEAGTKAVIRYVDGWYEPLPNGDILYAVITPDVYLVGTRSWVEAIGTRAAGAVGEVVYRASRLPRRSRLEIRKDGRQRVVYPSWLRAGAVPPVGHREPVRSGLCSMIWSGWARARLMERYPWTEEQHLTSTRQPDHLKPPEAFEWLVDDGERLTPIALEELRRRELWAEDDAS